MVKVSVDGKTVCVDVPTSVVHRKYKKILHRHVSIHADASDHSVAVGTVVDILPCRRISKTKSWKVTAVHAANHD